MLFLGAKFSLQLAALRPCSGQGGSGQLIGYKPSASLGHYAALSLGKGLDVVGGSQILRCGLKYVILAFDRTVLTLDGNEKMVGPMSCHF